MATNTDNTHVLGVRIDNITKRELLDTIARWLVQPTQHKIFTPNPEMLVDASRDSEFRVVLNESELNICDGAGLSFFSGIPKISGSDMVIEICALAEQKMASIFILGTGRDEVLEAAKKELLKRFPSLHIVGTDPGPRIQASGEPIGSQDAVLEKIRHAKPDILFVAFGHGKQEKWISKYITELPSVRVAMGVGGSFEFISGAVRRAPKILRVIGLEWLWRVVLQPWRFPRIIKAVVVFPLLATKDRFMR